MGVSPVAIRNRSVKAERDIVTAFAIVTTFDVPCQSQSSGIYTMLARFGLGEAELLHIPRAKAFRRCYRT